MITLKQLLSKMTTEQLIQWTISIDPNSSWDESQQTDPVSADQLRADILAAYDDADTMAWINR